MSRRVLQGNYAKFLKNLHAEQISKLQTKNQLECDILEDIRAYMVKRSAIEKTYSEVLQRLRIYSDARSCSHVVGATQSFCWFE